MQTVIMIILCTVTFAGLAYLMKEIIEDYRYCKKRREEERDEYLRKLAKQLKM